jgi:uncharacterized protein YfaA (DUF2138 family)
MRRTCRSARNELNGCSTLSFVIEEANVESPMAEKHFYELSIVVAAAHDLGDEEAEAVRKGVEGAVQGVLREDGVVSATMPDRRTILLRIDAMQQLGPDAEEAFSMAAQEVVVDALEAGDALRVGRLEPVVESAAPKF